MTSFTFPSYIWLTLLLASFLCVLSQISHLVVISKIQVDIATDRLQGSVC